MAIFEKLPYTNYHNLNADWIVKKVKEVADAWTEYRDDMDEWKEGVDTELQTFYDWFDNLDLTDEVRTIIEEMVQDGTFITTATPVITSATETWLAAHVSQGYAVDNTLTISGAAADAKVTGERITDLYQIANANAGTAEYPLLEGYYRQNNAQNINDPTFNANYKTALIRVKPGEIYKIAGVGSNVARTWSTANNTMQIMRMAESSLDTTYDPIEITIEEGEEFLCFNTQETLREEFIKCVKGNLIQNDREEIATPKSVGDITDVNDYEVIELLSLPHTISKRTGYYSYKDVENVYRKHPYSYGFAGLSDLTAEHELYLVFSNAIPLDGTQEFDLFVHSDIDATVTIRIALTKSSGSTLTIDKTQTLVEGWNKIQFETYTVNFSNWTNDKNTVRIMIRSNASAATLLIGALYQVKPPKAKIIVTDDHAYYGYLEYAYPLLSALGVPTTWGVRITRIGQTVDGATRQINMEEIESLAGEGNSEFSFHSWDGTATSDMTEAELRNRIQKCLYWLRKNGLLQKYFWRSACVQNRAPAMANIKDMLNDCATYNTVYTLALFPFKDRLNIPRLSIQGTSESSFDNFFNILEKTHCTAVFYTHDVIDDGSGTIHASKSEIDYFVSKVSAGVNGGWLEGTTINRLYTKYGLYFNPIAQK